MLVRGVKWCLADGGVCINFFLTFAQSITFQLFCNLLDL